MIEIVPAVERVVKSDADETTTSLFHNIQVQKASALVGFLADEGPSLMAELRKTLAEFDFDQSDRIYQHLVFRQRIQRQLEDLCKSLKEGQTITPTYLVSTEFLYQSFRRLMASDNESIFYASGSQFGNFSTIENLIQLELDYSAATHATANQANSTKALLELEKYGSVLSAYFHMHPGRGLNANHPSNTDLATQARLERGNFKTIGGIFSRDGYLRFFADKMPFQIQIAGKGIEHVGQQMFRLTNA